MYRCSEKIRAVASYLAKGGMAEIWGTACVSTQRFGSMHDKTILGKINTGFV